MRTIDPHLAENGLPDYPPLPATTESHKINDIRRTVVYDNLAPDVSVGLRIIVFVGLSLVKSQLVTVMYHIFHYIRHISFNLFNTRMYLMCPGAALDILKDVHLVFWYDAFEIGE